jgi:hypothetical protein
MTMTILLMVTMTILLMVTMTILLMVTMTILLMVVAMKAMTWRMDWKTSECMAALVHKISQMVDRMMTRTPLLPVAQ